MEETKRKILIIEDELEIREAFKRILLPEYIVYAAQSGEDGLRLAENFLPDIVILDIIMPGMDGIAVCEALRADKKTKNIPIIMVTATNDEDRRAKSFLSGADDVVSKPIKVKEFLARIQTKLKRIDAQNGVDEVLRCGNLVLDRGKIEATIDGKNINLTVLEFKLLRHFVQNRERVLTRDMILEVMWEKDVTARVIDNHIMSLRKKLGGSEYVLVSIYGAGYSFKKAT
jgi:DNA-binding response OmpR family regulator